MTHTPNWQERARRAEMIAERMSASLASVLTALEWGITKAEDVPPDCRKEFDDAQPALDAWSAHRADLDTLAQAQQEAK